MFHRFSKEVSVDFSTPMFSTCSAANKCADKEILQDEA